MDCLQRKKIKDISLCAYLVVFAYSIFSQEHAHAFVSEYGFGPQSSALAGMTTVVNGGAYNAGLNPARVGKGLTEKKQFRADYGISFLHAQFDPISNIVVENSVISTITTPRSADYDPSVPNGLAQTIGAEFLIFPEKNISVGVASFIPIDGLAQIDTGPIYHPEYVLFRTRWQKPKISVASAIAVSDKVRLGLGADIGFSVYANADMFLQAGAGTASDQRLTAKMKPKIAPVAGVDFTSDEIEIGFVARGESETDMTLETTAGARVFGSLNAALSFGFTGRSMIAYEPWSFELGVRGPKLGPVRPMLEVAYQLWSMATLPPVYVDTSSGNQCNGNPNCPSTFEPTLVPEGVTRNILVMRVGAETEIGKVLLRGGYAYRPSIFGALPSGVGNMIDPDRHLFAGGVEIPINERLKFNAYVQVQQLVSDTVIKTEGDEFGTGSGDLKIGAPGYYIGGWVYGGGVGVTMDL